MRSVFDESVEFSFDLTPFSPADLERVSGLSRVMQRDWRRRGFLPTTEGHATFDFIKVAEIWLMAHLAKRGLGPKSSQSAACLAARAIGERLLHLEGAITATSLVACSSDVPLDFRETHRGTLSLADAQAAWMPNELANQLFGDDLPDHGMIAIYVEGEGEARLHDLREDPNSPIVGPMFLASPTGAAQQLLAALGSAVANFTPGVRHEP